MEQLANRLGKVTVKNATATTAAGLVVIYLVGVLRALGQLSAEDVSPVRALFLRPLQDYFVDGLAVILNPETIALVLVTTAGVVLALRAAGSPFSDRPASTRKKTQEAKTSASIFRAGFSLGFVVVAGGVLVLVMPLANWMPFVVGAIPLYVLLGLIAKSEGQDDTFGEWSSKHRRLMALTLVTCFVLAVGIRAFAAPTPLDRAVIRTTDHRIMRADLIAHANGFFYLAGARVAVPSGKERQIIAVPAEHIARVRLYKGNRYWKNLLELVCVRFYRYDPASGDWARNRRC